ncbi:transcriptional regulator family: Fungal Specific TF [Paecilomyces variotii]|nr:transcriptional regulator family: Fungal Specific TF [Paecilomyces variotii]
MEAATPTKTRQRAYKACVPCRQRKAKCDLGSGADGKPPGPPCAKCRREQRQCVFPKKRAWERRRTSQTDQLLPAHEGTSRSPGLGRNSIAASEFSSPSANPRLNSRNDTEEQWSPNEAGSGRAQPAHHHENYQAESRSVSMTLDSSMVRTVVSSGNDALNILFEAATAHENGTNPAGDVDNVPRREQNGRTTAHEGTQPRRSMAMTNEPKRLSNAGKEVLRIWEACRFVRMGWFTAREAVTYIDLFFKNMSPLSPILCGFYSDHNNHQLLLKDEPILCCTILMISSRYHVLPGSGGASRSFFIHHRLWQHCEQLIMRLILGQEKSSKRNTRTVGTIEALLLMSEWHPRSLHFPPDSDGWDSDLVLTLEEPSYSMSRDQISSSSRWIEDVIAPATRSDRMSWMLLGCALSLAYELGIFESDAEKSASATNNDGMPGSSGQYGYRQKRVQRLLYIYINQHASRIGCRSLMPQSLNRTVISRLWMRAPDESADDWSAFMVSWMDLTKLMGSINDMFFPSTSLATNQLQSGRYIGLLDHFRQLLQRWRETHLSPRDLGKRSFDLLFIEYHFVRVYMNSIGMQAVVERLLVDGYGSTGHLMANIRAMSIDPVDYEFIQEVIDGCCSILQKVTELANDKALQFAPVRIFLRVTSSSIFLLKALSLGVRNAKLQESLDILDESIRALRLNTLDDIHLAARYATLLEVHVLRLRRHFAASSKTTGTSCDITRPSSSLPQEQALSTEASNDPMEEETFDADFVPSLTDMPPDDWLFLPFDPSMAPFGTAGGQSLGMEDGALDFIWNLPH